MIDFIILLFELFFTFSKIALFNFGGGFVMISLIQGEILNNGWLTLNEFNNIIAISQMTPGAIAINTATYVGYQIAGVAGAVVASLAIPIPSFFIVLFLSPILMKYKDHGLNRMIFYGIRPVVVALILNAAFIVASTPFLSINGLLLSRLFNWFPEQLGVLNIGSIGIFIVSIMLVIKYRVNPIMVILISAVLGMIVFSIF